MRRFILHLVLVWSGLWSVRSFSAPEGYYLGWAEIAPIERGIRVSFNPIDCNVCSFAVILSQPDGVLIAHFDVPLIACADQASEAQEGRIVARKAEFISEGKVLEHPNPPSLVLLREGGVQWTDGSSKRSFKPSELTLLTGDSVDHLTASGLFGRVEVMTRRTIEADPFKALESFKTSARDIAPVVERSCAGVPQAANRVAVSSANQRSNLAHGSAHSRDSGSLEGPTLVRVWPTNNNVGVSEFCHGLLFYGLGPTDLPSYPSGDLLLKAITDEETAIQAFGKSLFVRTRNGLRYFLSKDPVFHTDVGESHLDQCLATFGALNLPLATPMRLKSRSYSISDLLSESVANFSFGQKELSWTAIAYARYLPPQKEWTNRFRERASFSQVVHHLLKLDFKSQSCAGIHIFHALVKIDNADRRNSILDKKTRKQLDSYLATTLQQAVQHQQEDGSWDKCWCDSTDDNDTGPMTLEYRLVVTGHLLEVLNSLDSQRRVRSAVYVRAAKWVEQALNSKQIGPDRSWICPFTHAARAAREILTPFRTNNLSVADTFHRTE